MKLSDKLNQTKSVTPAETTETIETPELENEMTKQAEQVEQAESTATVPAMMTAKVITPKVRKERTIDPNKVTVRPPAKELMEKRKRVSFGLKFISAVLDLAHRDVEKMVIFANALNLGERADLRKLEITELRQILRDELLKNYFTQNSQGDYESQDKLKLPENAPYADA